MKLNLKWEILHDEKSASYCVMVTTQEGLKTLTVHNTWHEAEDAMKMHQYIIDKVTDNL